MQSKSTIWMTALGLGMALFPGTSMGSIVGGHNISITESPWQMLLRINGSGVCGAAWLGGRWVATAAHCVEGAVAANSYVYAGITRFNEAAATNRIAIKRIVTNPANNGISRDLALLELAVDVPSPLAKPIRYATPADVTAGLTSPGVLCRATGWGKTSPDEDLADSLKSVDSKIHSVETYVIKWAGQGGTANIGSCQGDSGGPLVVKDAAGTGWILAGISSYIQSFCGDPKSPSSYSRVSGIADFIAQYVPQIPVSLHASAAALSPLVFSQPGRFRLVAPQDLDITFATLAGVSAGHVSGFFQAGEHHLPLGALSSGHYVLRIATTKGTVVGRVTKP